MKILLCIGTRPEAIKMAPVVRALRDHPRTHPLLVSTGQHRELLTDTLRGLDLEPDVDLAVMREGQTLDDLCVRVHQELPPILATHRPDALLVQGDTTTAQAAALCAFHHRIAVGHVEAGLRTGDLASPFPEEANRQIIARVARWCFAPTEGARTNLLDEGIAAQRVTVTGNTAIDALLATCGEMARGDSSGRVLMTLHRRESFGEPLQEVLRGVLDFLEGRRDAEVLWPVHPNPQVTRALEGALAAAEGGDAGERLLRVEPLPYPDFCRELVRCRFVLTDSGGIQEEAPSLGKTVLVAREHTERPEAVEAGLNRLVGRDRRRVCEHLERAWRDPPYDGPLPAPSPYGDGRAAERIVAALLDGSRENIAPTRLSR